MTAAAGSNTDDADPAPAPADEEVASATLHAGDGTTISAVPVDTAVTFGGKKSDAQLSVTVSRMPDSTAASAASETAGVVASAPVRVTAHDDSGADVTTIEAAVTTERPTATSARRQPHGHHDEASGRDSAVTDAAGPQGVTAVHPGVTISIGVDPDALAHVDPASLQIFTRENPGDPWLPLASHYDAATQTVVGESGHLSQFIVIGKPYVAPVGPVIVLDPDDGVAHTDSPAKVDSELPYNIALANGVKTLLQNACLATVKLTREDPATPVVNAQTRADYAAAQNPALTATLAFDAPVGHAWGVTDASGGSKVFSNGRADSDAVGDYLNNTLPTYTTRPSKSWAPIPAQNIPQKEFDPNPGTYIHLEALNLDNNYDWPIIDQHMDQVITGVAEAFRQYLVSKGYNCLSPAAAGFPSPPTAAERAAWADLGKQNYQLYGSEPVSFSTGNLIEEEPLFTLPGNGGSTLDLTLTYNSQDGRLTRSGAGWSLGIGAHAQVFNDASVMIVRGDGASYTFTPNKAGGYDGDPSKHQTLTNAAGRITLTGADGQTWTFDATDPEGIGELSSYRDLTGNGYDVAYGTPGPTAQFLPIESITDTGGQVIRATGDAEGRVTSFTAPDARAWSFAYDPDGNLTSIGYPGSGPGTAPRAFTYDAAHRLLTATDPLGVTYLRNTYDAEGRVVKQLDAQNNTRTFAYATTPGGGTTAYTDNEGRRSTFAYDAQHRVTSVTDAEGGTKRYAYDAANNVTDVTDEAGNRYTYSYDANGNVTKIVAPDAATTRYTYTPSGRVASVTDQGGPGASARTTTYDVDARGLVTGIHLPDGSTVSNTYDAAGNLLSSTAPGGQKTQYAYDAQGHLTKVTDPNIHSTNYAYNGAGQVTSSTDPLGAVTSYRYDAAGNLAAVTDPVGGVTAYIYDGNGHLLTETDPTGAVTSYSWDALFRLATVTAPGGGTTTYAYNREDALVGTTNPVGAATAFTLDRLNRATAVTDPNGGVWKRAYDPLGQVTAATDPAGAVSRQTYDTAGRVTASTDPLGNTTRTSYDPLGRVTARTDPAGNTTSYSYDLLGRTTGITNPAGDRTTFRYDAAGDVAATTDPAGRTTRFTYDAAGNIRTATDPAGATVTYTYDAADYLTSATDALGRTSTARYDPRGLVTAATNPLGAVTSYSYDADARVVAVTDPNGHTQTRAYTPTGAVASAADALGNTTRYGYDASGRQTTLTDPLGIVTRYGYDPAGQLTSVVENATADPASTATANVTSRYRYDAVGNLAASTDPNGHATTFTYDPNSRPLTETNAAGNTWRYGYDNLGSLTSTTDAAGRTTRNAYDPLGNLKQTSYADGSAVSFAYDKASQPIAMTDALGVTGWTYDPAGRVLSQIDASGARIGYTYDASGGLTDLTLPTGDRIGYTYDKAGRPLAQSSPWGSLSYGWDAAGNLASESRSTGLTTAYAYDAANRVKGIRNQLPAPGPPSPPAPPPAPAPALPAPASPGSGGPVGLDPADYLSHHTTPTPPNPVADGGTLSFAYAYDANSDVTSATRTIAAGLSTTATPAQQQSVTKQYSYDPLGRLSGSTSTDGATARYGYDPAGNRISAASTPATTLPAGTPSATGTGTAPAASPTSQTATFNALNQLTATTGTSPSTYTYDANGQRTASATSGVTTAYAWSDAGRMTALTRDGRHTAYAYDGLGRQQSATDTTPLGTQTTASVWSGTSIVQQTNPASGTTSQVLDARGSVALQASSLDTADTGTRWNLLDRLGSVAAQNVGGSVTQLAAYDDFGSASFETSGWNAVAGFGGQPADPTSGLSSYFSRQYDPSSGSWLSPDAARGLLTDPQSLHRYAFVTNNPATMADQLGFRPYNPTGIVSVTGVQQSGAGNYSSSGYPSYAPARNEAVLNTGNRVAVSSAVASALSRSLYGSSRKDAAGCGFNYNPCASTVYLQNRHLNDPKANPAAAPKAYQWKAVVSSDPVQAFEALASTR